MARFIFMMLDGVGVGALPDASAYGDEGSDTLGNLSRVVELRLPFLRKMGLGNILPLSGVPPVKNPLSLVGRLAPLSVGKDTTVGHWEHMGLVTERGFPAYPDGFPDEILRPFRESIGRDVLGNRPASGTVIIEELGREHVATGMPIVYTSADSVFQIAAHVDVVPLEQLYGWCEAARRILQGRHAMARVIARPFTGVPGAFVRTKDRRDFSLAPPHDTYLDLLERAGVPVLALGKISEVFVGRGVAAKVKVRSNEENLRLVRDLVRGDGVEADFSAGLLFTNLVDFDMTWGHRNDVEGFAQGLEAVDAALPDIVAGLGPDDRLIISADHGVDPTTTSTDHSREFVPLLLYPRPRKTPPAVYEGGFADTGATIYEYLTGRDAPLAGKPIVRLEPGRGWGCYPVVLGEAAGMPTQRRTCAREVGKVGPTEAREAAAWLRGRLGSAPETAVILGSGLEVAFAEDSQEEVYYGEVPHWRVGSVGGHRQTLSVAVAGSEDVVVLQGRAHGYEGFDMSELQLPVHTLAIWGVKRLVITTSCGAIAETVAPGSVMVAQELLDFQNLDAKGRPTRLSAEAPSLGSPEASERRVRLQSLPGAHACLPGPQYETPAELAVLRTAGAATVSMSGAAELRAAHGEGLEAVVLCVVANAGEASHEDVIRAGGRARDALTAALGAVVDPRD